MRATSEGCAPPQARSRPATAPPAPPHGPRRHRPVRAAARDQSGDRGGQQEHRQLDDVLGAGDMQGEMRLDIHEVDADQRPEGAGDADPEPEGRSRDQHRRQKQQHRHRFRQDMARRSHRHRHQQQDHRRTQHAPEGRRAHPAAVVHKAGRVDAVHGRIWRQAARLVHGLYENFTRHGRIPSNLYAPLGNLPPCRTNPGAR